jgi:hypothetical protein
MTRIRFQRVRALRTAARKLGVSIMSPLIPRRYHWYLPQSLYSNSFYHRRCVEPVKRKHGGSERPQWVSHRFEIKDGISWHAAMMRDMAEPNPWWQRMKEGLETPERKWFQLEKSA